MSGTNRPLLLSRTFTCVVPWWEFVWSFVVAGCRVCNTMLSASFHVCAITLDLGVCWMQSQTAEHGISTGKHFSEWGSKNTVNVPLPPHTLLTRSLQIMLLPRLGRYQTSYTIDSLRPFMGARRHGQERAGWGEQSDLRPCWGGCLRKMGAKSSHHPNWNPTFKYLSRSMVEVCLIEAVTLTRPIPPREAAW